MGDDYYVDDFGNIVKREDLSDWTDYPPWQFWESRFNWIKCEDDLEPFDRIAWRDNVRIQSNDSEIWYNGARFVIGEVRKLKHSTKGLLVCITVLHSEGKDAYGNGDQIYRHIKSIFRNGAYRAPREDESNTWEKEPSVTGRPYGVRMKEPTEAESRSQKDSERPASRPGKSRFVDTRPPKPSR